VLGNGTGVAFVGERGGGSECCERGELGGEGGGRE